MPGHKEQKPERFSHMPWRALRAVARRYGAGAEKYGDKYNYRRGYAWSDSFDALQRHASSFWEPEPDDPESAEDHLAGVAFHALTLLNNLDSHPEHDDRPGTVLWRESMPGGVHGPLTRPDAPSPLERA